MVLHAAALSLKVCMFLFFSNHLVLIVVSRKVDDFEILLSIKLKRYEFVGYKSRKLGQFSTRLDDNIVDTLSS